MTDRDKISAMHGNLGNPGGGTFRLRPEPKEAEPPSQAELARQWVVRQGRVNEVMGVLGALGMERNIPNVIERVERSDPCVPLRTLLFMETGVK